MFVDCNENEKDFISLYKKFYPKIFNYVYRKMLNKETAEDITANTFLNAMHFIQNKNPRIENFNAWIYKIATNEINMHLRYYKNKKEVSIYNEDDQMITEIRNEVGADVDKYEDFFMVKKVIKNLKQFEQSIVEMHFFEKLDYKEISEITGKKESTLRSILSRTLKKIEKMMDSD